jgi:tetratricopeptide (TPR) repeat protein
VEAADLTNLLEAEQTLERQFVIEAASEPQHEMGWSAALLMWHIGRWRQRIRDGLRRAVTGQPVAPPPDSERMDDFNDVELEEGAGVSLATAGAMSDAVLQDLIRLWPTIGDRPFKWYVAETAGHALLRNSYHHPRIHLAEHYIERGDRKRADSIFEETAAELNRAQAPPYTLGAALYNLAAARVAEQRSGEALELLNEAVRLRPDLAVAAGADTDMAALRADPHFLKIVQA